MKATRQGSSTGASGGGKRAPGGAETGIAFGRDWPVLRVMVAMFLAALDQTIVATAMPTIGRLLGDFENLPWVVLTRGREIRLYAARPDTGVGRKGRSETFVEVNLALLPDQAAGYVPLLFGSDALREGGTVEQIVGAVYAKDWGTLTFVLFSNVLNPLIRWFKDKYAAQLTASA